MENKTSVRSIIFVNYAIYYFNLNVLLHKKHLVIPTRQTNFLKETSPNERSEVDPRIKCFGKESIHCNKRSKENIHINERSNVASRFRPLVEERKEIPSFSREEQKAV